jgi:tRNA modification GTPase
VRKFFYNPEIMQNLEHNSTVAAIATASGPAGIAVVRISGPDAGRIADAVTKCHGKAPSARQPGSFFHAQIVNPADGAVVDDAIVLVFRAPVSFTGEDVVEIQGHGGDVPARRVLAAVLAAGATPAPPGEFTRRAFLNGKLDLTQAEAVMDFVQARSEQAALTAQAQLRGLLGREIDICYEAVANLRADIEAQLDFEADVLPPSVPALAKQRLWQNIESIKRLRLTWRDGHLLRTGALVVICGCPNVGKSSLLNALLGKDRAIVSSIAGTTRDVIEESIVLEGIIVRLVDTAGLRDTSCPIEKDGVSRAQAIIKQSDAIIYVLDSSQSTGEQQQEF